MAPAIPLIAAAMSAAMSYQSYRTQKKASKTAEQIGQMNAANVEAETHEEATRLKENQRRALAETRATSAATGFVGGSQDIYATEMERTQGRELEWLKKSGKSRAAIERLQGSYTSQSAMAGAYGSLAESAGYAGKAAQAGYDWYTS